MFGFDGIDIKFIIIALYIFLYLIIVYFKPSFIYDEKNDSFRQFGVGYKNTTILPLWLVSILLAIGSYFIAIYLLHLKYNIIFVKS
jgi:ABC-type enterochelin transport system permease subunit